MSFLDEYKRNKQAGSEKSAFDSIIGNLLQKNLRGNEKSNDLTAMDMESSQPTDFVPSMIYAMVYFNDNKPFALKGKDFYDMVPVILCLGCDLSTVTGLNLNYIPSDVRAKFLDLLTSDKIVNNIADTGTNKFTINEKVGVMLMTGGISNFINMMKEQTGVDLSMCIRKYSRAFIKNVRLIEYDMWHHIPHLNFHDAVRGVALADVQKAVADSGK